MPPKKAQAPTSSRKPKAPAKFMSKVSVSKTSAAKKKVPTAKPSRRRRAPSVTPPPVPIWDRNITSQASRDRKRFKMSQRTMHEEIDEEHIATMAARLIGESRDTWGILDQEPLTAIPAVKTRRRAPAGFQDTEDKWLAMMQDMQNMAPAPKVIIPNSPARSPFLRLSLELREEIYKHLLIRPKPIIMKADWSIPERNPFVDHSIVLVCKQLSAETTSFIYKNNVFQALLRKICHQVLRFDAPTAIAPAHYAHFRNLVIDCSRDCYDLNWHEKTAKGLTKFVSAKAVIESLTLQLNPQKVSMTETALGREATPITFADFLWYPGPLMTAIRMLAPKVLKIVVKKGIKRFGMEVDMKYFHFGALQKGPLANRDSVWLRRVEIQKVENCLKSLKLRFEAVFEDDERAVMEGLCERLGDAGGVVQVQAVVLAAAPAASFTAGVEENDPMELSSGEESCDDE